MKLETVVVFVLAANLWAMPILCLDYVSYVSYLEYLQ